MSFNELIGKTITDIKCDEAPVEEIIFTLGDGSKYKMHHDQYCCETVQVEDINGDLDNLIGSPILFAYEDSSNDNPPGSDKENQDSFTWTFYRLSTIKGTVVIRWYGESNGYYSESVSFDKV